jgi:hypothetical protein
MRNCAKDERFFITVISLCFFLPAFVSPTPVCADGSIVAWGRNDIGQCTVPSPNADFIAIAAGSSHTLGLKGKV